MRHSSNTAAGACCFDTGNDARIFAHNVRSLGVDLTRLDAVVISHRHGDHFGGLDHVVATNRDVTIFAPREGFGVFGARLPGSFLPPRETLPVHMRYWDGNPGAMLTFGTAWPNANITLVGETTEIMPGFHVVALRGEWGTDLPLIELSLVIETPDGLVVVAGCSHPTIERILGAARETVGGTFHLVVGGMHLIPASPPDIARIAAALRDDWHVRWLAPAHCTGEPAVRAAACGISRPVRVRRSRRGDSAPPRSPRRAVAGSRRHPDVPRQFRRPRTDAPRPSSRARRGVSARPVTSLRRSPGTLRGCLRTAR